MTVRSLLQDCKTPFLRISPEIRYEHDAGAADFGNVLSNNQVEFLVSIRLQALFALN
jgi:hypothetical protein